MPKRGPKTHQTPFDRLLDEIRVTNVLLAAQLREHLGQIEIVRLLSEQTHLSAIDIASILGTSAGTVAVTLGRLRKRQRTQQETETHGKEGTPEADLCEARDGSERQGIDVVAGRGNDGLNGARGRSGNLRTEGDASDGDYAVAQITPEPDREDRS